MNRREIRQLDIAVRRDFVPHVYRDGQQEQDVKLLSKGLAAMAVQILTGWDRSRAGATVIDGPMDNGIDAIAANKQMNSLFLVQSKWRVAGDKTLNQSEANKFINGTKMLRSGLFDHFNERVQVLRREIEDVLQQPGARIVLIVATTCNLELDPSVQSIFNAEISASNRANDVLGLRCLKLSDFHHALVDSLEHRGPTVAADLVEWGLLSEPYKALHGRIAAAQLGSWYAEHGDLLFESNVRREIVDSPINRSIVHTLLEEPDNFWYFNNGVTILCKDWPQALTYGKNDKSEYFSFTDVSVVNGAQTVASIHYAMQKNPYAVRKAQVSVRFIALRDCPEGFGSRVTYATNFQNSVDSRDFIALDPEQNRLRKDFRLALGKEYTLRKGDPVPTVSAGCSVVDAVIALACAHTDVQLAVKAKNEIEDLWKSTEVGPYRDLFHPRVSAPEVWRRVQVVRMVDDVLYSSSALEEGLAKEVAVEGNRIIAHLVFRLVDNEGIEDPDFDWEKNLARVKPIATAVLHRLSALANLELSDRGSVRRMLNDVKKCQKLIRIFWVDFDTNPGLSTEGGAPRVTLRDGIREPEFRLQGRRGSDARGYRFGQGGFLVLKNSIAGDPAVPSLYPRYVKRRTQLIDEAILIPTVEGKHLLLKRDEIFDSPSDAGAVMTGCSVNGRQEWRTAEGSCSAG